MEQATPGLPRVGQGVSDRVPPTSPGIDTPSVGCPMRAFAAPWRPRAAIGEMPAAGGADTLTGGMRRSWLRRNWPIILALALALAAVALVSSVMVWQHVDNGNNSKSTG